MLHFTALRYGDRTGALSEVARRVQALAQAESPDLNAKAIPSASVLSADAALAETSERSSGPTLRNLRVGAK
jgi:hypothetical protein